MEEVGRESGEGKQIEEEEEDIRRGQQGDTGGKCGRVQKGGKVLKEKRGKEGESITFQGCEKESRRSKCGR